MPNQKISELQETSGLFSDCIKEAVSASNNSTFSSDHDDILFLTATENTSNQKISFENLKKSNIDNSLLTEGEQEISGSKVFVDLCFLKTQDAVSYQNLYIDEYINDESDGSCSARFEEGKLFLNSDKEVSFYSDQNKNVCFSNSGCLNINTNTNKGALNINGDAYINNTYVKNIKGNYNKLPLEDSEDETVCFEHKIEVGTTLATVYLPKTFKYKPIITANLFRENSQAYVPFILLNVNAYSFQIKFDSAITENDYSLHVSAFSPSILPDSSESSVSDARTIQRFHTQLSTQSLTHTINFPFAYSSTPSVHASVESPNNIVAHAISSVNNNSYTIRFESQVDQNYTIHTLSQESN